MKIVKEFILRDIAGEYVLVPTGATTQEFNGLITLTDTAGFIWENIEKAGSMQELENRILEKYQVEEETARKDTEEFVRELQKAGILAYSNEKEGW